MPDNNIGNNIGLTEYNRIVITQLENINQAIQNMNLKLNELENKVLALNIKEDRVNHILDWKNEVVSTVSIDDLGKIKRKTFDISLEEINDMKTQINLLREFKIRAVTIFSVVQFIMTVLLFWKNIT